MYRKFGMINCRFLLEVIFKEGSVMIGVVVVWVRQGEKNESEIFSGYMLIFNLKNINKCKQFKYKRKNIFGIKLVFKYYLLILLLFEFVFVLILK